MDVDGDQGKGCVASCYWSGGIKTAGGSKDYYVRLLHATRDMRANGALAPTVA